MADDEQPNEAPPPEDVAEGAAESPPQELIVESGGDGDTVPTGKGPEEATEQGTEGTTGQEQIQTAPDEEQIGTGPDAEEPTEEQRQQDQGESDAPGEGGAEFEGGPEGGDEDEGFGEDEGEGQENVIATDAEHATYELEVEIGSAEESIRSLSDLSQDDATNMEEESKDDQELRGSQASLTAAKGQAHRRTERLGSRARAVLGSTMSFGQRLSTAAENLDKAKALRYMNSYRLNSEKPFNTEKVHNIIVQCMPTILEDLMYDVVKCPQKAKWASMFVLSKIKEMEFDRYKLVCLVTIGEKHSQDFYTLTRFMWDGERDGYACFSEETAHLFVVVQCFGLYYE